MKDDRLYLLHISESLERIEEYVAEGREAFFADRKTQDAVLRNLPGVVREEKSAEGRGERLLERLRGRATSGLSTEEIMALTRRESSA